MPSLRRFSAWCCLALAGAACTSSSPSRPAANAAADAPAAEVPGTYGAEVPGTYAADGPLEGRDGAAGDTPVEGPAACGDPGSGATFADWPIADPAGAGAGMAPSFDTSRAGVVLDRVTGLEWQRTTDGRGRSFAEAAGYCGCLELGGHSDWRVPSRIELVSIVDFTRHDPAIDPVAFPGTPIEYFWSSSVAADDPSAAWFIAFFDGNTHSRQMDSDYHVRCVRRASPATAPQPRYAARPDGTVLDEGTGLVWQRAVDGTTMSTFAEAAAHCQRLPLAGGGWRLPSMKELQTLIDERASDPAIDEATFPDTPAEPFWASSSLAGMPGYAWFVSFSRGVAYNSLVERPQHVRCVR